MSIPDATPEQTALLLKPGTGGAPFRPYATNTIQVAFMTELPAYAATNPMFANTVEGGPKFTPFSVQQQERIKQAFTEYEKVANVHFEYTTSPGPGAIRLGIADTRNSTPDPDHPGERKRDGGVNLFGGFDHQTPTVNDIYINPSEIAGNPALPFGGYGYTAILHEIGHALGLKHPNESLSAPTTSLSRAVSVMSYADWKVGSAMAQNYQYGMTPLVLDVAAIQQLWGTAAHLSSDTVYTFRPQPSTTDNSDTTIYADQIKSVWDSGGQDTLDASAYTTRVTIDLRPGYLSSIGGNKNIGVTFNTQIENAWGGSASDTLTGNDAVNQLEGRDGADDLEGGKGDDTLAGGLGEDTYVYNTGDGADTIYDEGRNRIKYNGEVVSGAFVYDQGTGKYNWVGDPGGRSITFDAGGRLALDSGTTITFQNQATADALNGSFGLQLRRDTVVPTAFDRVILGDLQHVSDGSRDDLGNFNTTGAAAPGQPDYLQDSAGNDKVDAGGGDDYIDAWRGGNDYLVAGAGNDIVVGRDGDDIITGDAGMDLLRGDDGKDAIYADGVVSIAQAMASQDALASGLKGDFIDGSADDDLVVGGAGNDALNGGDGADLLIGGAGDDEIDGDLETHVVTSDWSTTRSVTTDANGNTSYFTLYNNVDFDFPTAGGDDAIYGGAGADWVRAGWGDDHVEGGQGQDVLFGAAGADDLLGGSDNDVLVGDGSDVALADQGDDYLGGDAGNDQLYGGGGADQLYGGADDDTLVGDSGSSGPGADYLDGGDGNDVAFGMAGDDRIFGGSGDDQLVGDSGSGVGDGNDAIDGGDGNDLLFGEGGSDELHGGTGDDQVVGDHGGSDPSGEADMLFGDAGNDTIIGQGGDDFVDGGADNDLVDGGDGNDVLAGGAGDDQLQGADGQDSLDGGSGSDVLFGEAGDDTMSGGDGTDYLIGGLGNDAMEGGLGNDVFYYARGEGSDAISDTGGTDWLVFNDLYLGDVTLGVGSLKLSVPGGEIHLTDFDPDNPLAAGGIEYFQFADGQVLSKAQLISTLGFHPTGTPGADDLQGTSFSETFHALAGDDVITARGGDDTIYSDEGNDQVQAGDGNDVVYGGDGNDLLAGNAGTDLLYGEAGDDTYVFGRGDGYDTATDALGQNHVQLSGLSAADVRFGRQGNDLTIATLDGNDRLTVKEWFGAAPAFADVKLADGTVLDRAGVEAAIPKNQPPVATTDLASVTEDAATFASGNVLWNDSDPEGRPLRVTDPRAASTTLGSFSIDASGNYSYQLFNGSVAVQSLGATETRTESFGYAVTDDDPNGAASAQGAVVVTVHGSNDLPVLGVDAAATAEDAAPIGGNVLTNDSDVDAGTVLAITQPGARTGSYGSLQLDAAGNWNYTLANDSLAVQQLAAGQAVQDSFGFAVTDGIAQVGGSLAIQVAGRNDAPVLFAPLADQSASSNSAWSWQLPAGSFTDVDQGDVLHYGATLADGSALPSWLAFDASTQTFSGRVPKSATGSIDIQVTATDTAGARAADVFTLAFTSGTGGGGGGGSNGNEGVGNGVDAPPPGHDTSFNDGPGTAPGSPGAQGGNGYRPPRRQDLAVVEIAAAAPRLAPDDPLIARGRSDAAHAKAPGQLAHAAAATTEATGMQAVVAVAEPDAAADHGGPAPHAALPSASGKEAAASWLGAEAWAEFMDGDSPSGARHDESIFALWRAVEDAMTEGADPLATLQDWWNADQANLLARVFGGSAQAPGGVGADAGVGNQAGTSLQRFQGLGNGVAPLA